MTMNNDDLHSISVLIVDGSADARAETQTMLARFGIGSDSCGSLAKAMDMIRLHHARRQDYDLILADRVLAENYGEELIREARAFLGENATVIIMTSSDSNDVESDAKKAGADAFMAKPLAAENILQVFRQALHHRQAIESTPPSLSELDGKRILIAEDMTVNAEIVKQFLSINFMEVDHVINGQEAVDLFTKSPEGHYDAILMDVRMPVMDGLAATKAIRASSHPNAKNIPIIALTTNYFDEDVQRSLEAGMNAHLEKPAEPEQIYRTLAELICRNRY